MEKIQVVLASPSDLIEERQMIKDLVTNLNPLYMKYDICIDLRMWEDSTPGMNANGPQGVIDIDLEIPKSDIFICLYWKRVGTKLENEDVAGTEHELNIALDCYNQHRKPDIKACFKSFSTEESNEDTQKIQSIAKKLQNRGLYTPFNTIGELHSIINKILQSEVMKRIKTQGTIVPEIHKYVEVSNPNTFISSLASNSKLVLNKGYYDILDFNVANENVTKSEVFDGKEIIISNLSNITIVGDNSILLVQPRYANVLNFKQCSNIKLIGLTLGHTPEKGYCAGSVLRFEDCNNIQLDSLELFGCGTYGIELYNCENVHVNGTNIFECSYGALSIYHSDIEFTNSTIHDCNKTVGCLIEASNSHLHFNNVSIHNNYIENYLISLRSSSLFCQAVCVHSNSFAQLCNKEIPFGIYEDNNIISIKDMYNLTISSTSILSKADYDKIKEMALSYGRIEEAIFDNGTIYLNVLFPNYDLAAQLEIDLQSYKNLSFSHG